MAEASFEFAHERYTICRMTKLGEGTSNKLIGIIAEHAADGRRGVEEGALERDDVDKIWGAVEEEHVDGLITIVGIERDGFRWMGGEGDGGGSVGGGGELEGVGEGRLSEESAELFRHAAHGHGGRAPVPGAGRDRRGDGLV